MIELSQNIISLIKTSNTTMVFTYFSIGKLIVDELQSGKEKAKYGTKL